MTELHAVPPPAAVAPSRVAHRAGNTLQALRAAIEFGVDWVEVDTWWQYGRLEARHEHAIWRLPIRYDEWKLGIAVRPAPRLAEICRLTRSGPRLLIDLKGRARRLPEDVIRTLRSEDAVDRTAICGQVWPLLDAAAEIEPALQILYSIETPRQLAAIRDRPPESPPVSGVSCIETLLIPEVIAWMRARDYAIFAWTVNDPRRAIELASLGVSGIISDSYDVLSSLTRDPARTEMTEY